MGDLLGLPEWLVVTLFVLGALAVWMGSAFFLLRRRLRKTAEKRASPTRAEFMAMLSEDLPMDVAEFMWATVLPYVAPHLAPHPDDDLFSDLMVDTDDASMDWPRDWARISGIDESNLPDWPDSWTPTVRNYGRWLALAKNR